MYLNPIHEKKSMKSFFHKKEHLKIRIIDLWLGKWYCVKEKSKQSYALAAGKYDSFHAVCKYSYLMGLGVQPQRKHFAIYTPIYYVWKQYFQLLNWYKIVTYIIILTFFLESYFNHKLALVTLHVTVLKDYLDHLAKWWGDKSFNFQTF